MSDPNLLSLLLFLALFAYVTSFSLSILLILLYKAPEASLAKTELSLECEGGKESELVRLNFHECWKWEEGSLVRLTDD